MAKFSCFLNLIVFIVLSHSDRLLANTIGLLSTETGTVDPTSVFGDTTCRPYNGQIVSGLYAEFPKGSEYSCTGTVISSYTTPTNNPALADPVNVYIYIDRTCGNISYHSPTGAYPCGQVAGGQLVQTYGIQCTDTQGVLSNSLSISVEFANCGVTNTCVMPTVLTTPIPTTRLIRTTSTSLPTTTNLPTTPQLSTTTQMPTTSSASVTTRVIRTASTTLPTTTLPPSTANPTALPTQSTLTTTQVPQYTTTKVPASSCSQNTIVPSDSSVEPFGDASCVPVVGSAVYNTLHSDKTLTIQTLDFTDGVIGLSNTPQNCSVTVTDSYTVPTNVSEYTDNVNVFIAVNPLTGEVYYNGGPDGASVPCGPEAAVTGFSGSLVQKYNIQCTDVRGYVSNILPLYVQFASCDVSAACL